MCDEQHVAGPERQSAVLNALSGRQPENITLEGMNFADEAVDVAFALGWGRQEATAKNITLSGISNITGRTLLQFATLPSLVWHCSQITESDVLAFLNAKRGPIEQSYTADISEEVDLSQIPSTGMWGHMAWGGRGMRIRNIDKKFVRDENGKY